MPLSLSAPRHHFSMHLTISVHLLQKQVKQMCGRGLPTPANMPLLPGLSSPYMPKKPGGYPAQTSQVKRLSSPWKDASVSVSTYSVHLLQQRLLGILPKVCPLQQKCLCCLDVSHQGQWDFYLGDWLLLAWVRTALPPLDAKNKLVAIQPMKQTWWLSSPWKKLGGYPADEKKLGATQPIDAKKNWGLSNP